MSRKSGWLGVLLGLVLAALALGPALGWGFVLRQDMVFVPDPAFSLFTFGLSAGAPRVMPSDAVVTALAMRPAAIGGCAAMTVTAITVLPVAMLAGRDTTGTHGLGGRAPEMSSLPRNRRTGLASYGRASLGVRGRTGLVSYGRASLGVR